MTFTPGSVVEPLVWPDVLPPHLSATQLAMLERCPEQFRQRYILGRREPPGAAMLWGSADGKAHGENFGQKIKTHEDIPTEDVREAFAWHLDLEIDAVGGASEVDWRDDTPATVKDRGVELVAYYHEMVSPTIQPTDVEAKVEVEVPGVPVPFIGYIDVDTEHSAIERKTARGRSEQIPPHYRVQTLGYALATRRPVEVHISTRTAKPAVYTPLDTPGLRLEYDESVPARAERMIQARARLLVRLFDEFGPDNPWPDAVGTMAWHMPVCDLCGYRDACSWWS